MINLRSTTFALALAAAAGGVLSQGALTREQHEKLSNPWHERH